MIVVVLGINIVGSLLVTPTIAIAVSALVTVG
jgi:hypothetical protein